MNQRLMFLQGWIGWYGKGGGEGTSSSQYMSGTAGPDVGKLISAIHRIFISTAAERHKKQ